MSWRSSPLAWTFTYCDDETKEYRHQVIMSRKYNYALSLAQMLCTPAERNAGDSQIFPQCPENPEVLKWLVSTVKDWDEEDSAGSGEASVNQLD